jgi:hypothetical protein
LSTGHPRDRWFYAAGGTPFEPGDVAQEFALLKGLKALDDKLMPRGSTRFAAVMNLAVAVMGLALAVVAIALLATDGWSVLRALQVAAGLGMTIGGGYSAARSW